MESFILMGGGFPICRMAGIPIPGSRMHIGPGIICHILIEVLHCVKLSLIANGDNKCQETRKRVMRE